MISLTDYISYLNQQFVDARKQADLAAVEMARAYAADEYLQHFKVPRFTMPVIRLKVPIKIDAVNQETKYDFRLNETDLIGRVNKSFKGIQMRFQVKFPSFGDKQFQNALLQKYLKELDEREGGFVRDVEYALSQERVEEIFRNIYAEYLSGRGVEVSEMMMEALMEALYKAIRSQFYPLVTNISNLAVTPQANGFNQDDSDKLLIHLDLELNEESIQIRKMTDENGNIIEEILVD